MGPPYPALLGTRYSYSLRVDSWWIFLLSSLIVFEGIRVPLPHGVIIVCKVLDLVAVKETWGVHDVHELDRVVEGTLLLWWLL